MTQPRVRTAEAAYGKWAEILPALGVDRHWLDGKHHPCPACGGKDRFRFDDNNGFGDYYCNGCGAGQGLSLVMKLHGVDYRTACQEVDRVIGNLPVENVVKRKPPAPRDPEQLKRLWMAGLDITRADPVGVYLASRGLAPPDHKAVRFVPNLMHYQSATAYPAMVALLRNADGFAAQVQRLYLTGNGNKAALEPNRMFIPGPIPKGGAVRLFEEDAIMGIAEGIETALSAAQLFKLPVWAATNENLLRQWQAPLIVRKVLIFGDNDTNFVGQCAAYDLAKRLAHEGKEVEVRIPETADTDWNDVLMEQ